MLVRIDHEDLAAKMYKSKTHGYCMHIPYGSYECKAAIGQYVELSDAITMGVNGKWVIPTVAPRTLEDVKREILDLCLNGLFLTRAGWALSIDHPFDKLHKLADELRTLQAGAAKL